MYNSIVFKSGLTIWITQKEADFLNFHLLQGAKFVFVARLLQTFNTDTIAYLGYNQLFFNQKVKDGEFRFSDTALHAKKDGEEFIFESNGKWRKVKDSSSPTFGTVSFDEAQTFDDVIKFNTAPGVTDHINNPVSEVKDITAEEAEKNG